MYIFNCMPDKLVNILVRVIELEHAAVCVIPQYSFNSYIPKKLVNTLVRATQLNGCHRTWVSSVQQSLTSVRQ